MVTPITRKRKVLFFIPFAIIAILMFYSWFVFLTTANIPATTHYIGLLLFIPIIFFVVKEGKIKKAILFIGIYLLLATFNILSFLPFVTTHSFGITIGSFEISSPQINGISLLILVLYSITNFYTLVDMYLDCKEARGKL